jgi:hypothetical protein
MDFKNKIAEIIAKTHRTPQEQTDEILQFIADNSECLQFIQSCVVGQSEQLKCGNPNPPCSPNIKFGMLECCNCEWGE